MRDFLDCTRLRDLGFEDGGLYLFKVHPKGLGFTS